FDDVFEGFRSIREMEAEMEPLSDDEIKTNLRKLKNRLAKSKAIHTIHLRKSLKGVTEKVVSWKDPLGSRVISDKTEMVRQLPRNAFKSFMGPKLRMQPQASDEIREMCEEYVENFSEDTSEILLNNSHDGKWKESDENLKKVAKEIIDALNEVWKNPTFSSKNSKSLNEGTYVTE
ncbi:32405_t:CDS:2, partial [Racocetra persica]